MFLNDLSDFCRSSKDTKKVSAVVEGGMNCMYFYFSIKCPNLFYRKVISPTTPPFVQNAWTLILSVDQCVSYLSLHLFFTVQRLEVPSVVSTRSLDE